MERMKGLVRWQKCAFLQCTNQAEFYRFRSVPLLDLAGVLHHIGGCGRATVSHTHLTNGPWRRGGPPLPFPSEPYFSTLRMKSLKPRRLPSQSFRSNVSHFPSSPAALIPELLDQTTSDERDRTNRLFRLNLNSLTCSVKPATTR